MGQNRSSAVMAQRREPKDSLDDFPTPPWATRALCTFLQREGLIHPGMGVREPAANRGYMARTLGEFFAEVHASDVADYGAGFQIEDYLFPGDTAPHQAWTITNPPFRLAEQFIAKARATSTVGVAMLVRTSFIEGEGRWRRLFRSAPPRSVLQFTERVVMHEGKMLDPNVAVPALDKKTGETVMRKPSTATAYCWLIWTTNSTPETTRLTWTGVCRNDLEKDGDYA